MDTGTPEPSGTWDAEAADPRPYRVVVNDEEQYSIWPADRELPAGWSSVGEPGDKDACLDEVERRWVDMRPRSVRAGTGRPPPDDDRG